MDLVGGLNVLIAICIVLFLLVALGARRRAGLKTALAAANHALRRQEAVSTDLFDLIQTMKRREAHQRKRTACVSRKAARRAKEIRRRERVDVAHREIMELVCRTVSAAAEEAERILLAPAAATPPHVSTDVSAN
jgi:hypothetical protein